MSLLSISQPMVPFLRNIFLGMQKLAGSYSPFVSASCMRMWKPSMNRLNDPSCTTSSSLICWVSAVSSVSTTYSPRSFCRSINLSMASAMAGNCWCSAVAGKWCQSYATLWIGSVMSHTLPHRSQVSVLPSSDSVIA